MLHATAFASPQPRAFGTMGTMSTTALGSAAIASSSLPSLLALDLVAAAGTALAVAPVLAAFDEAITRSAAPDSDTNLWFALAHRLRTIVLHPTEFFGSAAFVWMWIVFASTYAAANMLPTIQEATNVSLGFGTTVIVTLVNMVSGIAKDSAYAKLFGSKGKSAANETKTQTPSMALFVWFLRDLLAFTFILSLPQVITDINPDIKLGWAKFGAPIVSQYFTTPLHLLGINIVNNPDASWKTHIRSVQQAFATTVAARQMRCIPPYSMGGILNGWILGFGIPAGGAMPTP